MKAINDLKKELKTTDVEKSEEDLIITLLDNDFGIKNKIQKLIEKD
jgi:hypothetical protein